MKNIFGLIIKEIRKENNFTQKELATIFCTTDKSISDWENNKCTPVDFLSTLRIIRNEFPEKYVKYCKQVALKNKRCYIAPKSNVNLLLLNLREKQNKQAKEFAEEIEITEEDLICYETRELEPPKNLLYKIQKKYNLKNNYFFNSYYEERTMSIMFYIIIFLCVIAIILFAIKLKM